MSNKSKDRNRNTFGPFGVTKDEFKEEVEKRTIGFSASEDPAPSIGLANSSFIEETKEARTIILVVSNCKVVNVRETASKDSRSLGTVPAGTRFILVFQHDGWAEVQQINNPSIIGYIMDRYVVEEG